ncbi:positive transcriptional regulator of glucosyltransferase and Spp phenotype [Streptococcus pneumoniae CDC0288-04]|nr:positive transcriptional regulator of glucosyltransferase and Spp phenotype [Streptococcus pneumoniae CDC0288-04]EGJ12819.1 transcriptional activator, Rgg/GadR/MutR family, C-terminal domain protein [Streptococcus pneumoniae GA47368]EHD42445.1 transcriptional activator, Rgg/GadR/MutR family, C-terminal domain protein [Streptococcus pneumoniae GA44452]EHD55710.1 transcriptional activator, Rgg/GadR/MutR family, C-terminal domain protein [Streptococcus pneumoniae GA41410]EHE05486.1 transcriptio
MLSRFETGQSELSVEKFLFALENISASVEELLFLARGFQYDTDSELRKEITDVLEPKNIAPLEDLYRREYQKHAHSHNKQKHILNAIIIKSYMKSIDERVDLTAEEGKVLHDYLFSTEIWGIYELNLFSVSSPFLSVSLFTRYVREMVRKSDFLMEMSGNRNLFHTILLNGFLASIECEEFTNAYYFKRVIEEHFYKENETYFRIVYLWAEGLLDSKQGRVKEGQKKMEDAVRIFEMLGCNKSAEYYRNTTEC